MKITEHAAYQMGATGAEPTKCERLLFEAWMRGHCWKVCGEWNGKTYVADSEDGGRHVDHGAMLTRQLWAEWRDRAALTACATPPAAEQPDTMPVPRHTAEGALALIETHVPFPTSAGFELRALLGKESV